MPSVKKALRAKKAVAVKKTANATKSTPVKPVAAKKAPAKKRAVVKKAAEQPGSGVKKTVIPKKGRPAVPTLNSDMKPLENSQPVKKASAPKKVKKPNVKALENKKEEPVKELGSKPFQVKILTPEANRKIVN